LSSGVKKIIAGIFIIQCFIACDNNRVYEENLKINDSIWEREEIARFEFDIEDSTANYELYLNFRHAGDYPYRNLYLFTHSIRPDGKQANDTAQMLLADSRGKWMGKGIGDIYDYQFKFKEGVLFPQRGTYSIGIEQAMRTKSLTNVTDIGISIKRVNK